MDKDNQKEEILESMAFALSFIESKAFQDNKVAEQIIETVESETLINGLYGVNLMLLANLALATELNEHQMLSIMRQRIIESTTEE